MALENQCRVCQENNWSEQHHLHPIHLGGPRSGPTIKLCGNCHTWSHQIAIKLSKGEPLTAQLDQWYVKYPRAKLVVVRIIKAIIEAEENPLENVVVPVTIKITKQLRRKFHLRKLDYSLKNLESYIITLLLRDIGYTSDIIPSIIKEIKILDKK